MKEFARLSKQLLYNKNAKLHFISSQTVSVVENTVDYFPDEAHDGTLWIDRVESLLYRGYDIARCLEDKSPFKNDIHSLRSLPTQETKYLENSSTPSLSLGGRISILKRPSSTSSSPLKDMKLRFCVLEDSDTLSLRAVLHEESLKCGDIASKLGLSSYTESDISATFNGITGIAWSPLPSDNTSRDMTSRDLTRDTARDMSRDSAGKDVSGKSEPVHPTTLTPAAQVPVPGSEQQLPSHSVHSLEKLPSDTIHYIAELTEKQASAEENIWRVLRRKRITASMFGMVLKAIEGNKFPDYLFNNLMNKYDLSHVAAIKWGKDNENNAQLAYERVTGVKVISSGLWLHSSGILGASPDGLLPDGKGLVEFKCPYSLRDRRIEDAIGTESRFYIKRKDDGTVYLDKMHAYYHQIQGMLYIIDREYCDLCVWSPLAEPYILRINKNPEWEQCLSKLISFYFKQFIPRVTGKTDEQCVYEEYKEMVNNVGLIMEESKRKREERRMRKVEEKEEGRMKMGEEQSYDTSVIQDLPDITQDDIVKIAALTSSPLTHSSHSKLWFRIREHRLTSSSFHQVLSAVSRDSYTASLFKSVMDEYYMSNTNIAKLTRTNTVKAINRYEIERGVAVLPSGIWLDKSGILGASVTGLLPDGEGIVDVRCLYKYKDIGSINEIVALQDPNFYLEKCEDTGEFVVKKSHRVYPKIQGALYFSGRRYCDTITWTQNLYHVTRVKLDPDWGSSCLPVLRQFYTDKLFPKLCDKWGYENVVRDLRILAPKSE